jgi:predicted protein tyrosine phosphatase
MTSAARKHFEVRSARNAEFFRSDRPWAAISIASRHGHPVLSEANRVGLLRLVFDDITQADTPQSFTPALAAEILDFVASLWDQAEAFLIHCDVGLSRSPAVAAALSRIYCGGKNLAYRIGPRSGVYSSSSRTTFSTCRVWRPRSTTGVRTAWKWFL